MSAKEKNKTTQCQIPESVPIHVHRGIASKDHNKLLAALEGHRTIKHVLDWCLAHSPVLELADMVTQDEYTHDFIVPYSNNLYIVYDTS